MEDLVKKAKAGDSVAFSELIVLVRADLYRAAFSILRNDADSQDAVQETIIKIYYNLYKLRYNKNFRAWVRKIVINISKQMYKANKGNVELVEEDFPDDSTIDASLSDINFDHIFSELGERDKEIFQLHFVDGLTSGAIAKKLGMSHSNVRSHLRRGILKLRERHTPATLFIFVLCMFIATSVLAISIVSYIKDLFNLSDVGVNNDGVLMAIENLDWYQQVDMDYKDLGDGYRIKMEHLSMDEMCLYMIFDLESDKDISKYTDVSLPDLKVLNENNDVICDKSNIAVEQYAQRYGCKFIESDSQHMRFLVYMYADSFPVSKVLNVDFSNIVLYKKTIFSTMIKEINCNASFSINLLDKFANRQHTYYSANNSIVKKAIISETGFYAIIEGQNCDNVKGNLIDINGQIYNYYLHPLANSDELKYILIANFNSIDTNKLILTIFNQNIELIK